MLSTEKEYFVEFKNGTRDRIDIERFCHLTDPQLDSIVCDKATVLFTTALKEYGLQGCAPAIRQLFLARAHAPSLPKLLFIACENSISSQEALDLVLEGADAADAAAVRSAVVPANCVVDRICNKPRMTGQHISVLCEDFATWHVESSLVVDQVLAPTGAVLPPIIGVPSVQPYVVRKKWIVNALHLSIALQAHGENQLLLHEYLKRHSAGRLMFNGLAADFESIFDYWIQRQGVRDQVFHGSEAQQYYASVRARISGHEQLVSDAVTRFRGPQLLGFMKDFYRKVVDPYLYFAAGTGKTLSNVSHIIAFVDELIAKERFV